MENSKYMYAGKNIRYGRRKMGLTIEQLARDMNMNPGFLGLIERGLRGTTLEKFVEIADYLGIRFDLFIKVDMSKEEEDTIHESLNKNKQYLMNRIKKMTDEELELTASFTKSLSKFDLLKKLC